MRSFVTFVLFVGGLILVGRFLAEKKADAMVEVAAAMGRDGRYDEALRQLDDVQSWFSWTKAGHRVEDERKMVRSRMQAKDADREFQERMADSERQRREDTVRQQAFDQQIEIAKSAEAAREREARDREARERSAREKPDRQPLFESQ